MKMNAMLALCLLAMMSFVAPMSAQAHCGSCGTGDEKPEAHAHDHAEGAKAEHKAQGVKMNFKLADAEGNKHKLSDYIGKDQVVVLVWTNPDCPFIVRHYEEKTIHDLAAKYADAPVKMFLVDSTHGGTAERTVKTAEKYELDATVLHDPMGQVGRVLEAKTTPHVYIFDKEGELAYQGAIDNDPRGSKSSEERVNYVTEVVSALLDGEEAPVTSTKPYGCSVKYPPKAAKAEKANDKG